MSSTRNHTVVALYDAHEQAEEAVKELEKSGFDLKKLSIAAKNPNVHGDAGFSATGDRGKERGKTNALWGGVWGRLFGSTSFVLPGLGPVQVAGPLATWVAGARDTVIEVGGVSAIGAGLASIGIAKKSILEYDLALQKDKFLVLAHGTAAEAARAKEILNQTRPAQLFVHTLKHSAGNGQGHEA